MAKQLQGQARTDGNRTDVGFTLQEILLPAPGDLAKYNEIDPLIVKWTMQYADNEQQARIKALEASMEIEKKAQETEISFNKERVALTKSEHSIVKTSLWFAFIIAILFLTLSGIFIYIGLQVAGSIFGVVTLIMCVQAFLKFGRNQKQ
jgi:uncharacterized membrane protein